MRTKRSIRNCLPVFRAVCPQRWEELTLTDEPGARDCAQCHRRVYLCTTDAETIAHAQAGNCIAREIPVSSEMRVMYLGEPVGIPPETPQQAEAARMSQRERGIDEAIENAKYSSRYCPRCEYPAPDWRVYCYVCGFGFGRIRSGGPNGESGAPAHGGA